MKNKLSKRNEKPAFGVGAVIVRFCSSVTIWDFRWKLFIIFCWIVWILFVFLGCLFVYATVKNPNIIQDLYCCPCNNHYSS